jgi:hypothetical protein
VIRYKWRDIGDKENLHGILRWVHVIQYTIKNVKIEVKKMM